MTIKTSSLVTKAVFVAALATYVGAPAVRASGSENADAHIHAVVAITKVYSDGQKVAAVAIKYDKAIKSDSLSPSTFAVKTDQDGQKITGVYSTTDGAYFTRTGHDGQYVVLELSTDFIIPVSTGSKGPGGPSQSSAGAHPAAPKLDLSLNPEVTLKVGDIAWDPTAHPDTLISKSYGGAGKDASVTQVGSVVTTDGITIVPGSIAEHSEYVRNLIVDGFLKPDFHGKSGSMKYDIHFPQDYNPAKKYPLVVFLIDSNESGGTHAEVLMPGLGPVIWADKDEQSRHEAIVVVPASRAPFIGPDYQPALDLRGTPPGQAGPNGPPPAQGSPAGQSVPGGPSRQAGPGAQGGPNGSSAGQTMSNGPAYPYSILLDMLDYLIEKVPSIDTNRIYLTGEGDGARSAIKLMIDRPNLFAAGLFFAPDYDPAQISKLSKSILWLISSEGDDAGYPKTESCIESLKVAGARVSSAVWRGQETAAQYNSKVGSMIEEGNNIKYTVLKKGTILPKGIEDNARDNRAYTWRVGYSIQSLRDWLFTQMK